jgi:RNAse (barnase) inhibitor barstar
MDNVYLKIDKELSMQRDLQKDRMALWEEIMGSTN